MEEKLQDLERNVDSFLDNFDMRAHGHPLIKGLVGYVILIGLDCVRASISSHNAILGIRLANYIVPLTFFVFGYYVFELFFWLMIFITKLIRISTGSEPSE